MKMAGITDAAAAGDDCGFDFGAWMMESVDDADYSGSNFDERDH